MSTDRRIDWIDLTKGIAIFLMIVGHTSVPEFCSKYIWSFHMPLFFIISGMLFNQLKYLRFLDFFKRRIFSLLIPYFCFTLIVCVINAVNDVGIVWNPIKGWISYALWFVEVLFTVELLMYFVIKYIRKKATLLTCILCFLIGGWLMSEYKIYLPFKQNVVLWASFFYGFGFVFKIWLKEIKVQWYISTVMICLNIVICQFLPKTDMCFNKQGIFPINTIVALLGTLSIITLTKSFPENFLKPVYNFLKWGGKNTLIIMGLSQLILLELADILSKYSMPKLTNSFIKYITLFIILYILSIVINKYMPFIVGKKKQ